jgi:putative transposase
MARVKYHSYYSLKIASIRRQRLHRARRYCEGCTCWRTHDLPPSNETATGARIWWWSREGGQSIPRGKKFTAEQIIGKLREAEVELSRRCPRCVEKIGVTEQTYYRWKKEYGGLRMDQSKRLKELEKENSRLVLYLGADQFCNAQVHKGAVLCRLRLYGRDVGALAGVADPGYSLRVVGALFSRRERASAAWISL